MNSLFHKLWEKAAFDHLPPANLSPCLPFHLSHWNQRLLRSQTRLVEHRVVEKRPEFVYWNSRYDGNSEDSPELQNILPMHLLSSSSFPLLVNCSGTVRQGLRKSLFSKAHPTTYSINFSAIWPSVYYFGT